MLYCCHTLTYLPGSAKDPRKKEKNMAENIKEMTEERRAERAKVYRRRRILVGAGSGQKMLWNRWGLESRFIRNRANCQAGRCRG